MKAVKLRALRSKEARSFVKCNSPSYFKLVINFDSSSPVYVIIKSDICKCWTYVFHNVFDYLFQELKSVNIDLHISKEYGFPSFIFIVNSLSEYNEDIKNKVIQDLEKMFEVKEFATSSLDLLYHG